MKLPDSWIEVRLADSCALNPRLPSDARPDEMTEVTFVPMSAVDEKSGTIIKPEMRTFGEVSKGYTSFLENDVLFAKVTPCMENGKAAIAGNLVNGLGFGSTEFHVLRPTGLVLAEYIFHFIRQVAFRDRAASAFVGTGGLQRVPPEFLSRIKLPLPSLPEQQRIVDVLRQAEAVTQLRNEFDDLLARARQQLFVEMFGDPATNPKQWVKKQIGKLVKVKSGDFLPAKDMATGGMFKVYGGNGVNGAHDCYLFEDRKVVIGRVGAYCGAVHYTEPKSWVTDNALYVSEKFEYLNDLYLTAALELANLNRYAGRAGQPLISASRINPVEIMVPGEAEQDAYANAIHILQDIVVRRDMAKQQLSELLTQVTQQALIGELTADWREQSREQIEEAAATRDALLRERGAKLARRPSEPAPLTPVAKDSQRPARQWLVAELSRFQRQVLAAFSAYPEQPLLAEDADVFARFCNDENVLELLKAFGPSLNNRIRRTLSQLSALGLIAKLTLPKQNPQTGERDYLKAFRPLREDEYTKMADVETLRRALSSGAAAVRHYFTVVLDYETSEHAGAGGMFQVAALSDENDKDRTDLVDQGKHYAALDELADDIARRLGVRVDQIELEE